MRQSKLVQDDTVSVKILPPCMGQSMKWSSQLLLYLCVSRRFVLNSLWTCIHFARSFFLECNSILMHAPWGYHLGLLSSPLRHSFLHQGLFVEWRTHDRIHSYSSYHTTLWILMTKMRTGQTDNRFAWWHAVTYMLWIAIWIHYYSLDTALYSYLL